MKRVGVPYTFCFIVLVGIVLLTVVAGTQPSAIAISAGGTPTPTSTPTATPTPFPTEFVPAVNLSSSAYQIVEGYTAEIGVSGQWSNVGTGATVTTSDGTAVGGTACTQGVDYITSSRSVFFVANYPLFDTVVIATCPDSDREADETFNITLSASRVAQPYQATVTIFEAGQVSTPPPTPTPACGQLYSYATVGPITVNDYHDPAFSFFPPLVAFPYPSSLFVPDARLISNITVRLKGLNHTRPDDLDLLLVGPGGENAIIMSDVGGTSATANLDIILDDNATATLPDDGMLTSGVFRPTNIGTGDIFRTGAPVLTGGSSLSVFKNTLSDGTWSLFAIDDQGNGVGGIAAGFELTFNVCEQPSPTPTATPTPTISPTPTPRSCSPSGALDATFDGDGRAVTSVFGYYDEAYSVALQPDGKIIAGGETRDGAFSYWGLSRFNVDGSLDTSFAGDGKATTSFKGQFGEKVKSIAIQQDGKIVAAGTGANPGNTANPFAVMRFNPDGNRDTTFGSGGKLLTATQGGGPPSAIKVQSDGRIVVAGDLYTGSNVDFAVARYLPDGSLDATFDGDGVVTTPISNSTDSARAMAIQPDGKILVAGSARVLTNNYDFALVRYNPDGSLDTSFDGDGKTTLAILAKDDEGYAVATQADGRILVAGSTNNGSNRDFAIARFNADGSVDSTFDGDGKVVTQVLGSWDDGETIAVQSDGRIVMAGSSYNGSKYLFSIVRYNADGSLDPTFDGDGKLTTSFGSIRHDYAFSVAIQPDGRIVAGGSAEDHRYFAVARYGEPCLAAGTALFDYDGDRKADISNYRPGNGLWFLDRTSAGESVIQLGTSTDKIVPADYDGDGKTDVAVYRPSQGVWYQYISAHSTYVTTQFGVAGDIPSPADFDGDGKADLAVFRPSDGTWYIQQTTGGVKIEQFGANGDVPAPGDYDGDGKYDLVVWRPSNGVWYQRRSTGTDFAIQFGAAEDKIAPADYDGDGKTDVAVYRPSQGTWYRVNSSNGGYPVQVFGLADDIPVAADYDGDGRSDIGLFRPSDRTWYINRSTSGLLITQYGLGDDRPTPAAFGN